MSQRNIKLGRKRFFCSLVLLLVLMGCSHQEMPKSGRVPNGQLMQGQPQGDRTPDGLLRSDYVEGEINSICRSAIERTETRLKAIAQLKKDEQNFDNTTIAFEETLADLGDETTPLTFMGYVSTRAPIRAEGAACEEEVGKYMVDVQSRRPIYDAIKASNPRSAAEKRLREKTLEAFENNGLNLADAELEEVKKLNQELSALQTRFSANLNNDTTTVEFADAEMEGLSEDFKASLKRSATGNYLVPGKESEYREFMQSSKSEDGRRKMLLAFQNRAADRNVALLEQAIELRQKIATRMGFKSWAEFRIRGRMAKDSATVLQFLESLKEKLALRNQMDLEGLLRFKQTLDSAATEIKAWDLIYLDYQLKKKNYSLDDELIRQYFPADRVIEGLFEVYSKLLGVKFSEVKDARVWSSDVKLYRITEQVSRGNREAVIGYFYTDFFARPGKYGHAAAFSLVMGRLLSGGRYQQPISAIVANLKAPTGGKPSLLSHDDVETVFHEFGHIMHQTLTRAPYASLAGSSVAQDFVEAPSQMLENWIWTESILKRLSGHYLRPNEKIPADLVRKMVAAREVNQGIFYTRQLLFGLLDMNFHTSTGKVDTTEVYNRLSKEILGVEAIPGGHFTATFGHLMGGYDAGYYGYLWSDVYAQDMFTRFQKSGLLNSKVGHAYRHLILEQGNMLEGLELLRTFLGRQPSPDAFFKKLHIEPNSAKEPGKGSEKKGE